MSSQAINLFETQEGVQSFQDLLERVAKLQEQVRELREENKSLKEAIENGNDRVVAAIQENTGIAKENLQANKDSFELSFGKEASEQGYNFNLGTRTWEAPSPTITPEPMYAGQKTDQRELDGAGRMADAEARAMTSNWFAQMWESKLETTPRRGLDPRPLDDPIPTGLKPGEDHSNEELEAEPLGKW